MAKTEEPKPWDRRPWPLTGDKPERIFQAIGTALTMWEALEMEMALLFSNFVGGKYRTPARRSYVAVRTFEARCEMMRAASSAYFERYPDEAKLDQFKEILRLAIKYGPRRNDIAHGSVSGFTQLDTYPKETQPGIYLLYPSWASYKERTLRHVPSYAMNYDDIMHFSRKFSEVSKLIKNLYETF